MSVGKDDFVSAIANLNDLTRRRIVLWHPTDPVRLAQSLGTGYETEYEGRKLRLVEYNPPRVQGHFLGQIAATAAIASKLGAPPQADRVLEIIEDGGMPLFEFPKIQGITDLMDTVRAQQVDVEGLVRSLMAAR
jgi:hypothetical protein